MLVLTRKLDEAIRIGDDIKITVLRVKGNTVRIGIEAPREVRVVRDELETLSSDATLAINADRSSTVSPARAAEVASEVRAASRAVSVAPTAGLDLLSCEQFLCSEDEAVITTVVDSPQPNSSRLFVGRMRVPTAKVAPSNLQGSNPQGSNPHCGDHDGGDQAAPLRAFLRSGRKLQAVG